MSIQALRSLRLPDQITIDFGLPDVLAPFFLAADRRLRDLGVTLELRADFAELRRINEMNMQAWSPLNPMFDSEHGAVDGRNAFWILGRDRDGRAVVTQAARLFPIFASDLKREAESLRMFYPDPPTQAAEGETLRMSAPSAGRIKGRVVFSGSTWFHPDMRGNGLSHVLPRISRALAFSRWYSDFTISFVNRNLVEWGIPRSYGYTNIEESVEAIGGRHGGLSGVLVWMARDELVDDLDRFTPTLSR